MKSRIRCGAFHPFWTFVIAIGLLAGIQAALGQTPCATPPSGLVSWWRGEGNGADTIGTNHGTPQSGTGFIPGLVGHAFSFDGLNDYVQVSYSSNLSSSSYTVEAWVKPTAPVADSTGQDLIFGQGFGLAQLAVRTGTTGVQPRFQFGTGDLVNYPAAIATNDLPLNEYSHLVGTWDGTELKLYVNGLLNAQVTPSRAPVDSHCAFFIGGFNDSGACAYSGQFFQGDIDEVSYYTRALTTSEIQALYAAGSAGKCTATLPNCTTAPAGLVSWWRGEGNEVDTVSTNHGALQNGMGFATGLVGQAFSFNGTNQYVAVSHSLNPTGSFSIEGWIFPQADQTGSIACKWGDVGAYQNNRSFIFYACAGRGLGFPIADASTQWDGSFAQFTVANVLTLGEWNHVAAVYDQTTGTRRLFVNGTNVAARTDAPITPLASSASLTIGGDPPVSKDIPTYFHGLIDELSFYQRALSSNELAAIYAAGSAGKCAPDPETNCVPQPTGLVSWWRAEGNGADEIGGNHGAVLGNAVYGAGYVGEGFVLDGSGDGISLGTATNLQLQDFSIECWIKRTSATTASFDGNGSGVIFGIGSAGGGFNFWVDYSGGRLTLGKMQVNQVASDARITDTNWHHIAVTKAGTMVAFYVDGIGYAAPAYDSGGFTYSAVGGHLGGWVNPNGQVDNSLYGAIDELAVYNRALATDEIRALYAGGSAGKCAPNPETNCVPQPEGLVSWWKAEGNTADSTSANNQGTAHGGLGYTSGLVGQAFNFDGTNGYVDMPATTSLDVGTSEGLSVECWIKPDDVVTAQPLFEWFAGVGPPWGVHFWISEAGSGPGPGCLYVNVMDRAGGEHKFASAAGFVVTNVWQHVAATYDKATGWARLFYNGSLVAESHLGTFMPQTSYPLFLGRRPPGTYTGVFYRGAIDEPAVYSRALTATEIQSIYAAASAGKCLSQPAAVYDVARDFSTNSNPAGIWSYGYSTALGGDITLHTSRGNDGGIESWFTDIWLGTPNVFHNGTAATVTNSTGTIVLEPGQLSFHPGPNGEFGLVRFTVPSDGLFQITAAFVGADTHGTTTDVYLMQNGSPFFSGLVNGFGPNSGPTFQTNLTLRAGDRLDFAVGRGSNQEFSFDSTGLDAQIGMIAAPVSECASSPGGVVAWWRAEGGALDTVGNNHGEMRNGAAVAAGRVGQAFVLDGVDDLVEVPNSSALNPAGSFSLEGWIFPRQDQDREIVCKWGDDGDYSNNRSYSFSTTLDRGLTFAISDAAHQWDGAFHVLNVPAVLTLNAWNHVAGVYDQATGTRKLYVNGTNVAERTDSPIVVLASTAKLAIGARFTTSTTATRHFDGLIDEVSMYGVALSSTEIRSIYAAGANGKCPMLTNAPPIIAVQPASRTVGAGSNVTFTVSASGTWPFSYQWFFGDGPISKGTNATLTLTGVQPAQAGSYHVVVTNAYGVAVSSNALLTVLTYPPTLTLQPKSVTIYEGRTATFTAKAAGTAPLTYQWFFNGAALPGKTTTALGLTNVQSNNAGYYWLTASNGYGSATSSNATLTVLPPPVCISAPTGAVAWWRGESNTLDSVGIADALLVGTAYSGLYQTGKVGTAFHFYSPFTSGPYLKVPASDELDLGAGNGLTIEGWIQPQANDTVKPIISWSDGRYREGASLVVYAGRLEANLTATNVSPIRYVCWRSTNVVITNGIWQHVALTFDKPSGIATVFLNGAALGQTNVGVFRPQTQAPVYLGALNANGSYAFKGGLDEFTVYNRALAPAEIQAIVAADEGGKCPPPPPTCATPSQDLVAWWRGESNAVDSVAASYGTTISGAVSYSTGAVARAFQFSGGYVRVPANYRLNVGAGDGFTVEAWVKPTSTSGQPLIQWSNGTTAGVGFSTYSSAALRANIVDPEGNSHFVTSPTSALTSGNYQHVALTYSKASGLAALYVRGGLVAQTNIGSFNPLTQSDLFLGGQPTSSARFLGGLDEVSLYKRALTAGEIREIAQARGAGKCTEPPTIVEQPLSLKAADGGTARFGAVANGTPLLCYQWLKDGVTVPGATTASLVLSNVQAAQAGTYAVLVTNSFGAALSSNATLTIGPVATSVQIVSASADAMETFAVPVVMTATGEENALGFSLNFNPAHLSYVSVEPGSGAPDGPVLLNTSQVADGRLGVAVAAMPGMTFAAGTQQVARVSFTASALTTQTVSPITFGDQPLARQLVDAGYHALPATFADGSVTIAALDYEGDVSPRPAGDHNTTIADWVLVGRYATRLDYPTNASEFQRADCAPRAKRGDGRIKITDWVQAGRYAVGLDPLTPAGGSPAGATSALAPRSARSDSPCTVRVADATLAQGHAGAVSVILEAQGGEAGVGFSLAFDPAHLRYAGAVLGSDAAGAVLNVNATEASTGRLGVGLVFPAGRNFAAGKKEIVKLTFAVTKDAGSNCEITFGDLPVACDVADTDANTLSASFVNSALTINPSPVLTLTATGPDVTLAWPLWATNFVLQTATEPVASGWTNMTTSPTTGGDENRITLPKAGEPRFFRLYRP